VVKPREPRDAPGVIVFPPIILLVMLMLSVVFGRLLPFRWLARICLPVRIVIGLMAFVAGAAVTINAQRRMKQKGTNVHPGQPTLTIVTDGIFARSRNPIYVGGLLQYLGVAIGFAVDWAFLFLVPGSLVLHYGVVLREERYLERKFGDVYRRYLVKVPRYWP
jgi:protein-S-isoprenylcysteine O-methyltransferase Ste14